MPALFVRVKLFNSSGVMINMVSEQIQDLNDYNMYRLNISPKALKDNSNVDFTNVSYYVVDLADNFGQARIVERTYQYEEVECWRDYMNVMWVNSLGGLDSYQFIAPQDTITLNKFQMKRNLYGINSDGLYSDVNDNVYNPSDVLINNKVTTTTRVISKEIRDAEAYWLQELFSSKQAFVELTDMALVPLLVNNTSYSIPRLKYNRGNLNIISADFTLADGIIPTGAQVFGNSVSSIQFINSQMNTIQNNLPGFGITTTPTGHHIYSGNYSHNYM